MLSHKSRVDFVRHEFGKKPVSFGARNVVEVVQDNNLFAYSSEGRQTKERACGILFVPCDQVELVAF